MVGVSTTPTTEKNGEAKPECGCPGCREWRNDWQPPTREEGGITPFCWRHRIRKLEDQLDALLRHQCIKIVHEPERKVEAHYVVEKLPPVVAPSTVAKARRRNPRAKAR